MEGSGTGLPSFARAVMLVHVPGEIRERTGSLAAVAAGAATAPHSMVAAVTVAAEFFTVKRMGKAGVPFWVGAENSPLARA